MRLLISLFLIASICSMFQVSNGANCTKTNRCKVYKGSCKANCDKRVGEWAVLNGCIGENCKCRGENCKCCTSSCRAKNSCKRPEIAGLCVTGGEDECKNGRLTNGCKGKDCQCCIKPKDVKASFKLTNETYSDMLSNPNSAEYKDLKNKVEPLVLNALTKKLGENVTNFSVEFFRNGSVIVDSKVSTKYENQKEANLEILNALKNSGIPNLEPSSVSVGVRICIPAQDNRNVPEACAQMKGDTSYLPITCVEARDRYQCLQWLMNEEVDVVRGDPADVYLAEDLYGDDLSVVATTREKEKENKPFQYHAVAVVRRSSISRLGDLKGKKSCHSGYGKTSGWHVPFSKLLDKGEMELTQCSKNASVVQNNLLIVSSYFGEACIPGKWVPDDEIDSSLKSTYSNLCSLCHNPSECSTDDEHAGFNGALKCLIDSEGDVAWTKLDAVDKFFENRSDMSDFGLLCKNGDIVELDSEKGCRWAAKPWPAWLTRTNDENKAAIVSVLQGAVKDVDPDTSSWAKDVLGINKISTIKNVNPPVSITNYTKNRAVYYNTISKQGGCKGTPVRFCVKAPIEMQKCQELAKVLKSRRVWPALNCTLLDDCVTAIANDDADIIALDGGDLFDGLRNHNNIIPVISEVYGDVDASYFAVAVVWADSGIKSLAELEGKKSCHTAIGKTAGWKIPVVTLLEADLLDEADCDYAKQIGNFFSKSCAPGANLEKYQYYPNVANPESLCELCVGNGEENATNKCERDSPELYYSYTGAFRCLVEGGGDVAFIKHTTVPSNTDDKSGELGTWNEDLSSSEFRLLCNVNGTQNISEYESCHLARVPSHKVVTRNTDGVLQEEIRILLLRASEILGLDQDIFALFGDYGTDHDILFKSSATSLENLPEDDLEKLLNGTYAKALTKLDSCN